MAGTHTSDADIIAFDDISVAVSAMENSSTVEFAVTPSFSSDADVFRIGSGTVSFTAFTVILQRVLGSGCSLFLIDGIGTLNLSSMHISADAGCGTADRPLLTIGNGIVECTETTFTSITRFSGNGAVFEFNSSTNTALRSSSRDNPMSLACDPFFSKGYRHNEEYMTGMTFNACKCLNGNGGAMYLSIGAGKSVSLESLVFLDCVADRGGAVYAVLSLLTSSITPTSSTFSSSNTSDGSLLYIVCPDGIEAAQAGGWSAYTYSDLVLYGGTFWVEETKTENAQSSWMLNFVYPMTSSSTTSTDTSSVSGTTLVTIYGNQNENSQLSQSSNVKSNRSVVLAMYTVLCITFSTSLLVLIACMCQLNRQIQFIQMTDALQHYRDLIYAKQKQTTIEEFQSVQKSLRDRISLEDLEEQHEPLQPASTDHPEDLEESTITLYPG